MTIVRKAQTVPLDTLRTPCDGSTLHRSPHSASSESTRYPWDHQRSYTRSRRAGHGGLLGESKVPVSAAIRRVSERVLGRDVHV